MTTAEDSGVFRAPSRFAVHFDIRAHADQLAHVHEAILEDVLFHRGGAFGLGGQGHVLRLHVGGEAGVFFGGDIVGLQIAFAAHAQRIGPMA
jgi:hypothetical protein